VSGKVGRIKKEGKGFQIREKKGNLYRVTAERNELGGEGHLSSSRKRSKG